jgi:hypothetical protein
VRVEVHQARDCFDHVVLCTSQFNKTINVPLPFLVSALSMACELKTQTREGIKKARRHWCY